MVKIKSFLAEIGFVVACVKTLAISSRTILVVMSIIGTMYTAAVVIFNFLGDQKAEELFLRRPRLMFMTLFTGAVALVAGLVIASRQLEQHLIALEYKRDSAKMFAQAAQ